MDIAELISNTSLANYAAVLPRELLRIESLVPFQAVDRARETLLVRADEFGQDHPKKAESSRLLLEALTDIQLGITMCEAGRPPFAQMAASASFINGKFEHLSEDQRLIFGTVNGLSEWLKTGSVDPHEIDTAIRAFTACSFLIVEFCGGTTVDTRKSSAEDENEEEREMERYRSLCLQARLDRYFELPKLKDDSFAGEHHSLEYRPGGGVEQKKERDRGIGYGYGY